MKDRIKTAVAAIAEAIAAAREGIPCSMSTATFVTPGWSTI